MNYSSLAGHIVELCGLIDTGSGPADSIASEFIRSRKYLGSHDRRYITSIVFGIIRNRRLIEALLERYLDEHPADSELNAPDHRYIPLLASYLIVVEKSGLERVNEVLSGKWRLMFPKTVLAGYVEWMTSNQTFEFLSGNTALRLGVIYSFQDWMVERFSALYPDDVKDLLKSLNAPANTTLRVNTLKCTREECHARLQEEGIETELSGRSPVGLITTKRFNKEASKAFKDGWFELQDEGSQMVSLIADVKPGQMVIDACAGTGGKALHLAAMMRNEGDIVAVDIDDKRLYELQERAKRGGVGNVRVFLKERMTAEEFTGKADIVLIDAPCSGSGTIRRNPGLKWKLTESMIDHYAGIQKEILETNAPYVKPGGKLVYVTCSLFKEENEDVLDAFMKAHPEFSPVAIKNETVLNGISQNSPFVKFMPHKLNTDGFFIGMLTRAI